jgi:uncharacterized protein YdeI (BOF family)
MKTRNVILASLLCAASALAIAQGNGGGTAGQPAPDGGNNNPAAEAQGSSGSVAPMKHTSKKHNTKTKQPMSDSTNAPGASSATKAQ